MKEPIETFKALSDETRLRIMRLLVVSGKALCCCELTDSLEEPQYNISRHLKILKHAGLIDEQKEGRWVYSYAVPPANQFLKYLCEAVKSLDEEQLARDEQNLQARLQVRVNGKCTLGILKAHLIGVKEASNE
ncbi:MAG: metalloregulator ArsR/SmtB family transcription factor [Actinobacteria bacterium]|nr:metalloregulator ArsR/SmtB family transcription factor [Actinomycetota bacterium]